MVRRLGRIVVVALTALALVLVVTSDPGHGTQVNLHVATDAGAQATGAHHAKTIPAGRPVAQFAALVALLGIVIVVALHRPARRRLEVEVAPAKEWVLSRAVSRRGPPLTLAG
jgi:hypothetical protein